MIVTKSFTITIAIDINLEHESMQNVEGGEHAIREAIELHTLDASNILIDSEPFTQDYFNSVKITCSEQPVFCGGCND